MVTTAKVLKRKDASSVIVAVVIAMIVGQLLTTLTARPAGMLSGLDDGQYLSYSFPGSGWQAQFLQPVVFALLQLLVLEIILWAYGLVKSLLLKK